MTDTTAKTKGVHHVGLTVPELGEARDFFIAALGFELVGEIPDYPAVFVSDGAIMITLWRAEDPDTAAPFDRRKNLGLHHLAFRVDDVEALHDELSARDDVTVEFTPEGLGDTGLRHMMVRIPGNIRVEFVAA